MLDHEEERRLAEIEERLREDAPRLRRLLEGPGSDRDQADDARDAIAIGVGQAIVRSLASLAAAIVVIGLVTLLLGPNLGGLIGVLALSASGMYAYQVLRGCPGLRRDHDR